MSSPRQRPDSAALFAAIEAGDAQAAQRLLAADRSLLTVRNQRGESPVLAACYRRQRQVLDVLLAARPELDIWEAAAAGQLEAVRAHLACERSLVGAYSHDGWTPLHLAAFFGHEAVAAELLRRDASAEAWSRNALANQPLHAAAAGRSLAVCKLLVEAGADVNARQHGGFGSCQRRYRFPADAARVGPWDRCAGAVGARPISTVKPIEADWVSDVRKVGAKR